MNTLMMNLSGLVAMREAKENQGVSRAIELYIFIKTEEMSGRLER